MTVHLPSKPLKAHIPDDLTVPQFIFKAAHELRPIRRPDVPWIIEDETGRGMGEDEVSNHVAPFDRCAQADRSSSSAKEREDWRMGFGPNMEWVSKTHSERG